MPLTRGRYLKVHMPHVSHLVFTVVLSLLTLQLYSYLRTTTRMASSVTTANSPAKTIVGNPTKNFWTFHQQSGWDLTRDTTGPSLELLTTTAPITISPSKTAMIIIDMQNFFLSSSFGRSRGPGHDAEDTLLKIGIPAARKAGIQIMHVTWGLSDADLGSLPPTIYRIFGFGGESNDNLGGREWKGKWVVGEPLGDVTLENGTVVPAGRMLVREQWNTNLHDPLQADFDASQSSALPDLRFHKNRLSGFWGGNTLVLKYLREKQFRTLLFAGVNSDQCVLASIQDANNEGFDTIYLKDGCGTSSPDYTRQMVEFNCRKSWGFVSSCKALSAGVRSPPSGL